MRQPRHAEPVVGHRGDRSGRMRAVPRAVLRGLSGAAEICRNPVAWIGGVRIAPFAVGVNAPAGRYRSHRDTMRPAAKPTCRTSANSVSTRRGSLDEPMTDRVRKNATVTRGASSWTFAIGAYIPWPDLGRDSTIERCRPSDPSSLVIRRCVRSETRSAACDDSKANRRKRWLSPRGSIAAILERSSAQSRTPRC